MLKHVNESVESNDGRDEDIRESMAERHDRSINLPTNYVLASKSNSKSLLTGKGFADRFLLGIGPQVSNSFVQ